MRIIKAFCQCQQKRQFVNRLPVVFCQHAFKKLVTEKVAFRYAVMPAGNSTCYKLFFMRKPKNFGVLYHISAVARMAVKVNGNANIVQQRRCF